MDTVVLVLTDVQGSTRLWQDEPDAMDRAMARHREIVHGAEVAERYWRSPGAGPGASFNFGWMSHLTGLHQQAIEVTWPLVAQGVTRQDPALVHVAACVAALALLALGRTDDALAAIEPWRTEIFRRDWASNQRWQCRVLTWGLLQQGDVEDAAELVTAHLPIASLEKPVIQVLAERTERLAGRLTDFARLPDLLDDRRPHRYEALDLWLCLAVEQAFRVDGAERTRLLKEIVAERRGLYLPFGYQEDLDQLLGAG